MENQKFFSFSKKVKIFIFLFFIFSIFFFENMKLFWKILLLLLVLLIGFYIVSLTYERTKGIEELKRKDYPIHTLLTGEKTNNHSSSSSSSYFIPKIIWTYWHKEKLPEFVAFNLSRWERILGSEYTIRLITETNLNYYIPETEIPSNLKTYSKQHQADWIRLYLLKTYGGIWADSGILFNSLSTLNTFYDQAMFYQVDQAGFNINKLENLQDPSLPPVIENWFIMVPDPHSFSTPATSLINLWFEEFTQAIQMGFKEYRQYAENVLKVDSQNIFENKFTVYLTCHLCLQTVLQKRMQNLPTLLLLRAEDTMFRLHECMKWNLVNIRYALQSKEATFLPWIKLRGGDRRIVGIEKLKELYS